MAKPSKALLLAAIMMCSLLHAQASHIEQGVNEAPVCNAERSENWTVGLIQCNDNLSAGYTLFSPMSTTTSYLIDNDGREVHNWISPGGHRPGMSAYLLDDGSLLRASNIAQTAVGNFSGGGTAGKVERISWEGDLLWSFEYSSTEYISHHDIEPMPNGNILMIAWEAKTEEEGLQAGRNPAIASDAPGGSSWMSVRTARRNPAPSAIPDCRGAPGGSSPSGARCASISGSAPVASASTGTPAQLASR